jgi:phosphoribosylamine--glycine ligase
MPGVSVFHAGTEARADGSVVAAGGRVLTICGVGADVRQARERAYAGVDAIVWPDGFCRRDIGARAS